MGVLLNLSHRPPVAVTPETSVFEAVELMTKERVGALSVVDANGSLIGIFSERDLMARVVLPEKSARETVLGEVMTTPVVSAQKDGDPAKALRRMVEKHIRHLPVVDDTMKVLGMVSIRNLLQAQYEKAQAEAESLEAYISADGPGG